MYFRVQVSEKIAVIINQTCLGKFVQYLLNAGQVAFSDFGSTTLFRPDKPLIVKRTFDRRMKRITLASSRNCSYDPLRERGLCMDSSSDDCQKPNCFHSLRNTLHSQRHHPRLATKVTMEWWPTLHPIVTSPKPSITFMLETDNLPTSSASSVTSGRVIVGTKSRWDSLWSWTMNSACRTQPLWQVWRSMKIRMLVTLRRLRNL